MLPDRAQILVVDDEPNLRKVLAAQLEQDGYEVHTAEDGVEALALIEEHHVDLLITDLRMPRLDGMGLLRRSLELEPDLPIVMLTAHGTIDTAVEALKTGAFDYMTKPFDRDEVRAVVAKALKTRALAEADATRGPTESGEVRHGIIGQSPAIAELHALIDRVADTPTTTLIVGESGTGKELVARALHECSSRRERPFIKVNCAAIPKDLIESELFGYEKGAFTGAVASKPGRFELASGGTLFLDEIGTIPIEMQVKLLRAFQESEFERVGGIKTISVDVRLVAATNADLKREVAAGRFREDLFYRLNVVTIPLVPLRERHGDTELLAKYFLGKYAQRLGREVRGFDLESFALLADYPWPGNVRELENVVERAVLFSDTPTIRPQDLPPEIRERGEVVPTGIVDETAAPALAEKGLKASVKAAMSELERELIQRALERTGGNVTHTARLLKISRKGLQIKMKELGLRERDDRPDMA